MNVVVVVTFFSHSSPLVGHKLFIGAFSFHGGIASRLGKVE